MRVAITVKTYPNPSTKYSETVCTAGVDIDTNSFVRLYPVRFRDLPYSKWFKKWEIIEMDAVHKSSDVRGDTYTPNPDSIKSIGKYHKGKKVDWARRDALVLPLASNLETLCERAEALEGSIGLVRVDENATFYMREDAAAWSEHQLGIMSQESLFGSARKPLEKIPWSFRYKFHCADNPECTGHDLQVFDWEPFELYRGQCRRWSPEKARADVLHQYNERMGPKNRNVHVFVGTTISHPTQFSCIGIYAPPFNT
jgi:hypothetical protein